jgi:phosphopantothenoylcysteine decarboxylase/phosphopantothenate--cysteine ligase
VSSEHQLRIVVGITGGIAAYKAVSVVRAFVADGHHVDVIATDAALNFVGRPTLEAISRNPVHVGLYDDVDQVRHVALGQQAHAVVIAPATANTLATIASGLAPDLLGNTVLARRGPLVIAPAMHTEMWNNPATQSNITDLLSRGVVLVGPGVGALTGDDSGVGRMAEPEEIVAATYAAVAEAPASQKPVISEPGDLNGKHILITAGGTREPIDPVRFIGNRSSGSQAVALAARALSRGAAVTLIAAHIECEPPVGAEVVDVSTAREMAVAVETAAGECDVVIMAAAVADYRPSELSDSKLKKENIGQTMTIELVQNPDILANLVATKRPDQLIVGFAAETEPDDTRLLDMARSKLARKGCDLLVVNRVGWDVGFGTGVNDVTLIEQGGMILSRVQGSKLSVADGILDAVTARVPFQNA